MPDLALLWHLHQPDYRDPVTREPVLPWTRLHALRGYLDLPAALMAHGTAMTVNLVPVLIEQVQAAADGVDDPQLRVVRRPAADIAPHERASLGRLLAAGHPAMWSHPAARRLRTLHERGELSDAQDLHDLQVWSQLAWFGFTALNHHPELAALRRRGRGFDDDDKALVLAVQPGLAAEVLRSWRALAQAGIAEVSASPHYHPILPLVIDSDSAHRNLPDLPPSPFRFHRPDDALLQLRRGRAAIERATGRLVHGLWPPEGSVSPETVELAERAGFHWIATDEAIWARSERDPGPLHAPWRAGKDLVVLFRDHSLSDDLGFRWAGRDPERCAQELLTAVAGRDGTVVTVALDGENPWESFPDAGKAHLDALCRALETHRHVRPVTCREAARRSPGGRVHRLHTGSWIQADFAIWFGHPADRAAWSLLADARAAVAAAGDPAQAREHLLAAEGSDWFWWFGEEFPTEFAPEFDRLFRAHVAQAWRALGATPPDALERPVDARGVAVARLPSGPVRPLPRHAPPAFWEWGAGGQVALDGPGGAMARSQRPFRAVAWGTTVEGRLWVRLDSDPGAPPPALHVTVDGATWRLQPGDPGWHEGGPPTAPYLALDLGPAGPRTVVHLRAESAAGGEFIPVTPQMGLPVAPGRSPWPGPWA